MCSLVLSGMVPKICKGCSLSCEKIVWGYGNYKNRIIFIGEAPGLEEKKLGKPFVGRSGKLLTKMLVDSGIGREVVYITNIVKCRPENNRRPTDEEINKCSSFLKYELLNIRPELIITLGSTATSYFLKKSNISKVMGLITKVRIGLSQYLIYPIYHPSYVLRGGITKEEYLNLFVKLRMLLYNHYSNLNIRFSSLLVKWSGGYDGD